MTTPDLNRPVEMPPPGVQSNFINPPNHAALAYSTLVIPLIAITIFTWVRFIFKLRVVGKLHREDYLIPFAWLCALGQIAPAFIIYSFAPIIHSWDMHLHTFAKYVLYFRLSAAFYNLSILLIKVSMLIQVLRVFVQPKSKTYFTVHTLIWITSVYHVATVVLMIVNCVPIEKAWKPWLNGKCLPIGAIAMVTASMNLFTDLAILAIAQRVIWGVMRSDCRTKWRLSLLFCAGIVPITFATLCVVYNTKMIYYPDFVYNSAIMSLACHGEITSGLFVLFVSIVPRLIKHIKARLQNTSLFKPKQRAPSRLEFSDIGVPGEMNEKRGERILHIQQEKSLWHISYTQKGGENDNGEAFWQEERKSEDTIVARSVESKEGLEYYANRKC